MTFHRRKNSEKPMVDYKAQVITSLIKSRNLFDIQKIEYPMQSAYTLDLDASDS